MYDRNSERIRLRPNPLGIVNDSTKLKFKVYLNR